MPILRNGRVMTDEELTQYYRQNLYAGRLPVAGYFCPYCKHELDYVRDEVARSDRYVCWHCDKFGKEAL